MDGWIADNGCRTFVKGLVKPKPSPCRGDPLCLDVGSRSLLKNIRTGLIDPDTPEDAKKKKSADGKEWKLVVSLSVMGEGSADGIVLR